MSQIQLLKPETRQASAYSGRAASIKRQRLVEQFVGHFVLAVIGLAFFLPFVWMVSTSLKELSQIYRMPPVWIPEPIRWQNYPEALGYFPFLRQLGNTLTVAFSCTALILISSTLVAFSFSRLSWPGRNLCFFVMLATMMLPYQVTMVPLFIIYRNLGWVNTFLPLIVPAMFGAPFFIFMLRQFFLGLPRDLDEAAILDGCSSMGILTHVILPLAKPALATVALFQFLGSWNDFLGPLIYLNDPMKYTLSLGIQVFSTTRGVHWGWLMAVTTVLTVPVVTLFFFTQRTFIQGIALTGMKA